jgi:hypothetical protein
MALTMTGGVLVAWLALAGTRYRRREVAVA